MGDRDGIYWTVPVQTPPANPDDTSALLERVALEVAGHDLQAESREKYGYNRAAEWHRARASDLRALLALVRTLTKERDRARAALREDEPLYDRPIGPFDRALAAPAGER